MQLRLLFDLFLLQIYRRRQAIASPTDALPLDILRIISGLLILAYFLRTLFEVPDISVPDGLIDHHLSMEMFWFTRMGLFGSWMDAEVFQAIFVFACLCSVCLIIGFQVKLSAAVLYLIAVSTYRWNFLVMYVDDAIMHLLLFWMLVLPVGRTLILADWLKNGRGVWGRWKTITVPGTALRCFLWNLALLYLVAGLWKWTSPMWRDGVALYVDLQAADLLRARFLETGAPAVAQDLQLCDAHSRTPDSADAFSAKRALCKICAARRIYRAPSGLGRDAEYSFCQSRLRRGGDLIFREELMDWLRAGGDDTTRRCGDTGAHRSFRRIRHLYGRDAVFGNAQLRRSSAMANAAAGKLRRADSIGGESSG